MKVRGRYIPDRDEWILSHCEGKRVLHLGCTDWPVTEDRLRRGELLHQKLVNACSFVVGVDPDQEGIASLKRLLPQHSFHVSCAEDMLKIPEIADTEWDVVLAADVVEHVSNLGAALDCISSLMTLSTKLLITTPSAFSLKRFLAWTLAATEHVHPDHCYYFSPSTMAQVLGRSSIKMEEYGFFMWKNRKTTNRLALNSLAPLNRLVGGRLADEVALVCGTEQRKPARSKP